MVEHPQSQGEHQEENPGEDGGKGDGVPLSQDQHHHAPGRQHADHRDQLGHERPGPGIFPGRGILPLRFFDGLRRLLHRLSGEAVVPGGGPGLFQLRLRLGQGLLPLFDLRLQGFQIGQLPLGPLQLLLVGDGPEPGLFFPQGVQVGLDPIQFPLGLGEPPVQVSLSQTLMGGQLRLQGLLLLAQAPLLRRQGVEGSGELLQLLPAGLHLGKLSLQL